MTLRFSMDFPDNFSDLYNKIHSSKKGKMMLEIEGIDRNNLDIVKKSKEYFTSNNVADVSIDANANVDNGINHASYVNELMKPFIKLENYYLIYRMIEKEYGEEEADRIFNSIIYSDIYLHDPNSVQVIYCFSVTTSKIMFEGRPWADPIALPPKTSKSFMGQVIETVMNMASTDFAGAIAIADLFVNYSYYAKKENLTDKEIENDFQSFVHIANNKFSRGAQAAFTNLSVFCKNNLKELFGDYMFPDGSSPDFDFIMKIQKIYMEFFCKGDPETNKPYRFPVLTASFLHDKKNNIDLDDNFLDVVSENNIDKGIMNIYTSNSIGKISSCCRLSNDVNMLGIDSFGNGGLNIGSLRVVSLNLPRFAIESEFQTDNNNDRIDRFYEILDENLDMAHKVLIAHRKLIHKRTERGFLSFVDPIGYIDIDKMLFSTVGIIGMYEMMYFLCDGQLYDKNGKFKKEVVELEKEIIEYINNKVIEWSKQENVKYNLEEVPGESLAPKFALKDKIIYGEDIQQFSIYSNQFVPLHVNMDIIDRMRYEGEFFESLSGGGISHINMSNKLSSKEDMKRLIKVAIDYNLQHFAINYNFNVCENDHVQVGDNNLEVCSICGGEIVDNISRVVGFFVPRSQMNKERRENEFFMRKFKQLI